MPNEGPFSGSPTPTRITAEQLNAAYLQKGLKASRPVSNNDNKGGLYWATDTNEILRSNGTGTGGDLSDGWDIAVKVDAVAATASLRTLGTGATQASAGNHTHIPSSVTTDRNEDSSAGVTSRTTKSQQDFATNNTYVETNSISYTPGATNRALVIVAAVCCASEGINNGVSIRILFDGVEKAIRTRNLSTSDSAETLIVSWLEANPTVAAHTITCEVKTDNIALARLLAAALSVHEVKV